MVIGGTGGHTPVRTALCDIPKRIVHSFFLMNSLELCVSHCYFGTEGARGSILSNINIKVLNFHFSVIVMVLYLKF